MAAELDTSLTSEDVLRIRSLTVGGFGPVGQMRAYHRALDLILPRVKFALVDVTDPRTKRGRQPAVANHRKRLTRCELYRRLAWAAVQCLTETQRVDRNLRRREQRIDQAAVRSLQKAKNEEGAAAAAAMAEQKALAQKELDRIRRSDSRSVVDGLVLNLRLLLDRYTRLRGERRLQKIGEIVVALNVGSGEAAAIRQRFRRMPADMKAAIEKQKSTGKGRN